MTFAGTVPGVLGATIRDASGLPEHLPGGIRVDPWSEALPGVLLFTVPGIARYLVQDGTAIHVELMAGGDLDAARLFLHGSARGALIHQRGELALVAATVVTPKGAAIAIAGSSGMGKSTLAAELCRRGWQLMADDITRVSWTRGHALAWPSHNSLKLWRDACEKLGIDTQNLPRIRERMTKFYVKMPAVSAPTVLRAIIRLQKNKVLKIGDAPTNGMPIAVGECVFRPRQTASLRRPADHDVVVRQVASVCRVMELAGAREFPVSALADQIVRVIS